MKLLYYERKFVLNQRVILNGVKCPKRDQLCKFFFVIENPLFIFMSFIHQKEEDNTTVKKY